MTTIPERIRDEAQELCNGVARAFQELAELDAAAEPVATALLAAEKRGREEERERCAVFLERFDPGDDNCRSVPAALDAAAAAIRSTN